MQKMERRACDNKYLHKDFHVSLDIGLSYVAEHYGEAAVEEYLIAYANSYYRKMSLEELEKYFKDIYEAEEASEVLITRPEDGALTVEISECPAMKFMRSTGHEPSKSYPLTTRVLYGQLAKICGLKFELSEFDDRTGRAKFTFSEVGKK